MFPGLEGHPNLWIKLWQYHPGSFSICFSVFVVVWCFGTLTRFLAHVHVTGCVGEHQRGFGGMDELSFRGHWLEAGDGFGVSEAKTPIFYSQYDDSQFVPFTRSCELGLGSYHRIYKEEMENVTENPLLFHPEMEELSRETIASIEESESPVEAAEPGRTWLIDKSCAVEYRLMLVIEYLKQYVEERDILIQIWVPINSAGAYVLTTVDQPYALNPNSEGLASYRNVSRSYNFPAEADSKKSPGLPGRVFLARFPEWSPDVRYFKSDECPRITYANLYSISGCLALPIFERCGGGRCLAVIEIVTTTRNISYHLELHNISKALEAVDLKTYEDRCPHNIKSCDGICRVVVPEIADILESICKTFRLPLALTWTSCFPLKTRYEQHDEKDASCIATVDSACFLTDSDVLGFYEACSEQVLFPEQGIVGKAFSRETQVFSTDVASLSKTSYPLSHHARMFNMCAAIAIPLQNIHTGLVEFALELFLPKDCQDIKEQKQMWDLLSVVIKQACRSYNVVMERDIEEEINRPMMAVSDEWCNEKETQKYASSWIPHAMEDYKGESVCLSWECPKEEPEEEFGLTNHWDNDELDLLHDPNFPELEKFQQNFGSKGSFVDGEDPCIDLHCSLSSGKVGKKKTKTEKTISLQVLQHYFAESLKDAAKSIGVCPTTLKRICRQHGINRWPSRKIKKVSHSLKKLQLVVDSVEGAKGLIQIGSIYTTFPELQFQNFPGNDPFRSSKMSGNAKELNSHADSLFRTDSNDSRPRSLPSNERASPVEDPVTVLKRTYSEAELRYLNEEPMLVRTHNATKAEHRVLETPPPITKSDLNNSQDGCISTFRIKASFGDENVRFSMPQSWSFGDLKQEITKRFSIDDLSGMDLKYLDNDRDAVLLACDADLEECKELFRFSLSQTIRISLHQASTKLWEV